VILNPAAIKRCCQQGFALLEFSLSLLTGLSLALFFLSLIYTGLAQLWLGQVTYDAAICLAEGKVEKNCEEELKLKAAWVGARAERARLNQRPLSWTVNVDWKLAKGIELSTRRSLAQRDLP
jgi:hypothetical protein